MIYVMRMNYQPMICYNRYVIQPSQMVDEEFETPVD